MRTLGSAILLASVTLLACGASDRLGRPGPTGRGDAAPGDAARTSWDAAEDARVGGADSGPSSEVGARDVGAGTPGPRRIFWIGHSLIEKWVPNYVRRLGDAGGHSHEYAHQILIGASLAFQWNEAATNAGLQGEVARTWIPAQRPDALIMTDATPPAAHESNTVRYGGQFHDLVLDANPAAKVYLYHYWPSRDAPNRRAALVAQRAIYDRAAAAITAAYAGEHPGSRVEVIPAGEAVVELLERVERGEVPGLRSVGEVYEDDIHLRQVGMYLAALVSYAAVFEADPRGLPGRLGWPWGSVAVDLTPETAAVLQDIAYQVVFRP